MEMNTFILGKMPNNYCAHNNALIRIGANGAPYRIIVT